MGGGKEPALTVPQARVLLTATLPLQHLDAATVLRRVRQIQRQNYAAACSHQRRTLQRLDDTS